MIEHQAASAVHLAWIPLLLGALSGCGGDAPLLADTGAVDAGLADAGGLPPVGTGGTGGTAGTFARTSDIGTIPHTWTLHVPDSTLAASAFAPVPLLLLFHPLGFTGSDYLTRQGLDVTAADNAFVVVAPDGYAANWMGTWAMLDGTPNSARNDRDLVLAIIDEVGRRYDVDQRRIFAAGSSAGSVFATLLLVISHNPVGEMGGFVFASPFAAFGLNCGGNITGLDLSMTAPKSAVWVIHGDSDPVFPHTAAEQLVAALEAGGFPVVRYTLVAGGTHTWHFDNQALWDFFMDNPAP